MGTLTLSGGGMPVVVSLTATVTQKSNLTITPNSADFMVVSLGMTSAPISFEVKNNGGTATGNLSAVPSTGEFSVTANTCNGTSLGAGQTCNVSLAFHPTSAGAKTALLTLGSGVAGEQAIASLQGTGAAAVLTASPMAPNFGTVATNVASAPITVTITNSGGIASGALMTSLTGTNASQWAIMGNNCNGSLAPAATCTVALVFTPTTINDKTATLLVSAAGGSVSVTLSGSGIAPNSIALTPANPFPATPNAATLAGPPSIPPGPALFTEGTVVGTTSAPVTITVANPANGTATGHLTFSKTDVAAGEYTIGATNCPDAGLSPATPAPSR